MRVLHVLHQSLPDHKTGYDLRTQHILLSLKKIGIDVCGLTGLYCTSKQSQNEVDGITYYHVSGLSKRLFFTVTNRGLIPDSVRRCLFNYVFGTHLKKIIHYFKPDVIHAHTPWFTAMPAMNIARDMNIPFVYEIRGLWEESESAEGIIQSGGNEYKTYQEMDNKLCSMADAVVTISENLKKELSRRISGIENRITVIPNGVNTEIFKPVSADVQLKERLGLKDKVVIGYISSLRKLEGVDYLIKAIGQVSSSASLMIVGDGKELDNLKNLVKRLHLENRVHFVGRIPYEQIASYYSIIDIFVVPRINARVCQLVTPLKPLEAMAMGKPVIASNVGGLAEMIKDKITGILFEPENVTDLKNKVEELIFDSEKRKQLGNNASKYIFAERQWGIICNKYKTIYETLLSNTQ